MSRGIVDQITELLKDPVSPADLAKIEKIVREAKRKAQATAKQDFWEGKATCWEMCSCPSSLHLECPTFKNRQFPCWEIEGTYCKLDDYGAMLFARLCARWPGTIGVREIGAEQHQVSCPIIANPIADHPLPFAVSNQGELKFRMIMPIEWKLARNPFISVKGGSL